MALIKCPECGKEISDKAASCPKCGFPIQNVPQNTPNPPTPPDAEEAPKKRANGKRIAMISVAAVALVAVIAAAAVYLSGAGVRNAEKAADAAVTAVENYMQSAIDSGVLLSDEAQTAAKDAALADYAAALVSLSGEDLDEVTEYAEDRMADSPLYDDFLESFFDGWEREQRISEDDDSPALTRVKDKADAMIPAMENFERFFIAPSTYPVEEVSEAFEDANYDFGRFFEQLAPQEQTEAMNYMESRAMQSPMYRDHLKEYFEGYHH